MWLKLVYDEEEISKWPFDPHNLKVVIEDSNVVSIPNSFKNFRVSPIFPLVENIETPDCANVKILFFHFPNAYRTLGRLKNIGGESLRKSIFFSVGLASIILITNDSAIIEEFKSIVNQNEIAWETWEISNSFIKNISYDINSEKRTDGFEYPSLKDYSSLSSVERPLLDEFAISIQLLLLKVPYYMPGELAKVNNLIEEVNSFISDLIFLSILEGDVPNTIPEFTIEELRQGKSAQIIKHQILDRIIQINSALTYVATQAFSGAIPILERRSLIRRHSLLGVGGAMLALNNIIRFIEHSFSKIDIEDIMLGVMSHAAPLPGLNHMPDHVSTDWHESSISKFKSSELLKQGYLKLPYFSNRLGFRETEYSIAAAIQSISASASLEWSLLTLTHEMLHGHVRTILSCIFRGDEKMNAEDQRHSFYENFYSSTQGKREKYLIESIRNCILSYCLLTSKYGSLTRKVTFPAEVQIHMPGKDDLWNILEYENRNISEIFVHVLDLHYFYASRIEVYIPLIWASWLSVPHINGNLRQYILRSLVTIASKDSTAYGKDVELFERFNSSVSIFQLILEKQAKKLNNPIITEVLSILKDKNKLTDYYLGAFKSSLIIVDLITNVFISEDIRGHIFQDDYAKWVENNSEESVEESFIYDLPDGFNDEVIKSPLAFLLAKMISALHGEAAGSNIERETVIHFVSLNSTYNNEH